MPSENFLKVYKCMIVFFVVFFPFYFYGLFSPFSNSYLILSYITFIILNFLFLLLIIRTKRLFFIVYFFVAAILGFLLFNSSPNYIFRGLILFLGVLAISSIFYNKIESKPFKNILIAVQCIYFIMISFSLLNLNIIHLEQIGLSLLHPLAIFHLSLFILFVGYSSFNLGKLWNKNKLKRYGVYSTFGLLYLFSGISILLDINYELPKTAAISFGLGLIATLFVFYYLYKKG